MATLKTQPTRKSVSAFLAAINDPARRADCRAVMRLMREITGARPRMWGPSIVGYGRYHYRYQSGREGDWFLTGFSPRAQSLTLYIMSGFSRYGPLMKRLGKYKTGSSCLYINRLADVDLAVLQELIEESVEFLRRKTW